MLKIKFPILILIALFQLTDVSSQSKKQPYANPFNDVYSLIYYLDYGAFGTRKIFDGELLLDKVKEIEISYTQYAAPDLKGKRIIRAFDENGFLKEYSDGALNVKMITVNNPDSTKTIVDEYTSSGRQLNQNKKRGELKYYRLFDKKGKLISLNSSDFINSFISGDISYEYDEKSKSTKAIASSYYNLKWNNSGYLIFLKYGDYTTDLQYTSNGKVSQKSDYRIGSSEKYIKNFKYDEKGEISKIIENNVGRTEISVYQNEYIDNTKMVYQNEYFQTPFTTYSYDESHRVTIIYSYGPDEKGELTMRNAIRIKYY